MKSYILGIPVRFNLLEHSPQEIFRSRGCFVNIIIQRGPFGLRRECDDRRSGTRRSTNRSRITDASRFVRETPDERRAEMTFSTANGPLDDVTCISRFSRINTPLRMHRRDCGWLRVFTGTSQRRFCSLHSPTRQKKRRTSACSAPISPPPRCSYALLDRSLFVPLLRKIFPLFLRPFPPAVHVHGSIGK